MVIFKYAIPGVIIREVRGLFIYGIKDCIIILWHKSVVVTGKSREWML